MILDNKTLVILAFCDEILKVAQNEMNEGNSETLTDKEEDLIFLKDIGLRIVKYCNKVGATVDNIARLVNSPNPNIRMTRANISVMYPMVIDHYENYVKVNSAHIPILYAIEVFRILSLEKVINFPMDDLIKALEIIEKSGKMRVTKVESKIRPGQMKDQRESSKFMYMVSEIMTALWKADQVVKKVRRKNKNRGKRK